MANELIDRIPPHSVEAEQSLLGALLIDKEAIHKMADMITDEDFYKDIHRIIFSAMVDLYAKHDPIDLLSLGNRLEEKKQLEMIGGRSYLIGLANNVPTASNVVHYAEIVQKKSTLRRLQAAASYIMKLSFEEENDVEVTLDDSERKIFSVSQRLLKKAFTSIREVLSDAFERIDDMHKEKGKLRGLTTGFSDLDKSLAGLQKSDLLILAARPSVGKTSLALDLARNAALNANASVGFFSLEMSKDQLVDRMICAQAGVDLWKMRTGKLSDRPESDDFNRIGTAIDQLSNAKIFIDDTPSANIMEIRTKARRLKSEHGLDLIILDYLQLMEGRAGGNDGRTQEVSEISRGLKSIARELDVPFIALSQLNRAVELSKPAIPKMAHLRESGSIEQDADVVLFIYRKAADRNYRPDQLNDQDKYTAEIHIAKHRNGPTGIVSLFFDEQRACFRNLDRQHGQEEAGVSSADSFDMFS
ncbi:MAG: replicative DNA helicase [bacterium]|nr:replicative DNA helicase [bacterium]